MGRREILVFIAAFAVVLLGGAALAQVGTFSSEPRDDAAAMSQPALQEAAAAVVSPTAAVPVNAVAAAELASVEGTDTEKAETPVDEEAKPEDPPAQDDKPKEDPPAEKPPSDEPPQEDADDTPPRLEILFPEAEQHFDEATIPFEGKTEPGARVFAGRYEADVDAEGNWRIVLILNPGGNLVTFKAKDAAGNAAEKSIKVFLDQETDVVFSAYQKWEVVDGYPAVNKYYGKARPGAKVWVGSTFGEGQTRANENGDWELRVEFNDAPCNETFGVVVEADGGHRREFSMKYACASHEFTAHQKSAENDSPWTKFYGTGKPGTRVVVVSEHGSTETTVEGSGVWFAKLHFNDSLPANKEIAVVVEGEGGRAEFGFLWIVKEIGQVEFTANQKYGSCAEPIPYDKFFGTAAPGSTIWADSPYGSGATTANESGEWLIRVDFPEAPAGEAFTVVIESSDGGRATFTFVRTEEGDK